MQIVQMPDILFIVRYSQAGGVGTWLFLTVGTANSPEREVDSLTSRDGRGGKNSVQSFCSHHNEKNRRVRGLSLGNTRGGYCRGWQAHWALAAVRCSSMEKPVHFWSLPPSLVLGLLNRVMPGARGHDRAMYGGRTAVLGVRRCHSPPRCTVSREQLWKTLLCSGCAPSWPVDPRRW